MSDDSLPENIAEWPKDPHALLGVPRTADERALKRAYTKLIRLYKPEHAPDKFRRIREAYDVALQRANLSAMRSTGEAEETWFVDTDAIEVPSPPESADAPSTALRFQQALDEIDIQLMSADPAALKDACQQIEQLAREHPAEEEVAVRHFWLMRLYPHHFDGRSPVDALRNRLRQHGLSGRTGELFLQVAEGGDEPLPPDFDTDLLFHPQSRSFLLPGLRLYWHAAAERGDVQRILEDLQKLQSLCFDDLPVWLSVLRQALEVAASMTVMPKVQSGMTTFPSNAASPLTEFCRRELQDHAESSLQYEYLFDRAELWLAVVDELTTPPAGILRSEPNVLIAVMDLVKLSRPKPFEHPLIRRKRLLHEIRNWLGQPISTLYTLDHFVANYPALARNLYLQIYEITWAIETLTGRDLSLALATDIRNTYRIKDVGEEADYRAFLRHQIMRFCLNEFADVDEVRDALRQILINPPAGQRPWLAQLNADQPLRLLVRGTIAYWSQTPAGTQAG